MVAPTLKTPRITNADKPSIVLDPGTFVFNNDTNVPEYVNLGGAFVQLTPGGTSVNVIQQQLWVNDADGLDTNDGGLYTPFKTYAAAAAHAALSASPTNRFVINVIGDQTSASPVLYPYVDICWYAGTWTVTGGLDLHSSWDNVVNNETVTIQGTKISGFWVFNWIGNTGNVIKFVNCDHSLTDTGNSVSNSPAFNAFMILNDTAQVPTSYSSGLFITQTASYIRGLRSSGTLWYNLLQNGYTINHYLYDSDITFGIVLKKDIPNTSTQNVYVKNTPMPVNSPVLEDPDSICYIDTDSYLNDPTFLVGGAYSQLITRGVNGIRQQLWVNAAVGNDLNNGSPNAPMATYDAARSLAASKASPTNRYLINVVGDLSITGDFNINPYIDLNFYDSTVTVSGAIQLDASWTVSSEKVVINGFKPICANLSIAWASNTYEGNVVTFNNPNFAQCTTGFLFSSSYSNGNDNTVCIINDLNPFPTSFSGGLTVSDVKSRMEGVNFGSDVNYQLVDDDYAIHHYMSNCYVAGAVIVSRPSGNSAQFAHIKNCFINNPITLDSQGGKVYIDPDSYSQVPTIGGLNTIDDFIIAGITDGLLMSTFTPSQYSFASGSYPTNALTGFMKGIDNALGALGIATAIDDIALVGASGTGSIANVGSYEMKVKNLVTCTMKITFTSASTDVVLTLAKTYGGNFGDIKQCVGGGWCSRTTPVINDAQVQSIVAVVGTNHITVPIKVTSGQDYILELQFMYEVT